MRNLGMWSFSQPDYGNRYIAVDLEVINKTGEQQN